MSKEQSLKKMISKRMFWLFLIITLSAAVILWLFLSIFFERTVYKKVYDQSVVNIYRTIRNSHKKSILDDITRVKESSFYIKEISIYDPNLLPLYSWEGLNDNEKFIFKEVLDRSSPQEISGAHGMRSYYSVCPIMTDNGLQEKYFIKIELDFSFIENLRILLMLFFFSAVIAVSIIITFAMNKTVNKAIKPFSILSANMQEFAKTKVYVVQPGIESSQVKEINMLVQTYNEMANELSANIQELRAINEELENSYSETQSTNEKLEKIINLGIDLSNAVIVSDREFLKKVLSLSKELVPQADFGYVYLIEDGDWVFIDALGHNVDDLNDLSLKKEDIPDFQKILLLENKEFINEKTVSQNTMYNYLRVKKPCGQAMVIKLTVGSNDAGGLCLEISRNKNIKFSRDASKILETLASFASAFLTMQRFSSMQNEFQRQIIISMVSILEIYDNYTKGHSDSVANCSLKIGARLSLTQKQMKDLYWSGLLHDIGKILVSPDIVNKPGRLTIQEYEAIKKHPVYGYEVLNKSDQLKDVAVYIKHHHERWDGNGYPNGLKEEEIPLISRIIAIADSWDAMRTDRSYRKGLSTSQAIKEMRENSGKQFDPEILEVFLRMMSEE
ncbi:MAG TPA: HD-GYP domain-containing protein [Petrotogaceae bacterium]|nr:HD-GYP domain-containing protein [Petrotogaceae bacterium]